MSKSRDQVAYEFRAELRSILRQICDLHRPIERFERDPSRSSNEPQFYVMFNMRPRRKIIGLKIQSKSISHPDERILDAVLELAKSVWHLKDRIVKWLQVCNLMECGGLSKKSIETWVGGNLNLRIAADLANEKKHGENRIRSKLRPSVPLVEFDTSQHGVLEIFYDGAIKEQELLVSNPLPLPFSVPVVSLVTNERIGDAAQILEDAFRSWLPLIRQIGVLVGIDPETIRLRQEIAQLEAANRQMRDHFAKHRST